MNILIRYKKADKANQKEKGGLDYFVGKLNNGHERWQLLLDFAESGENKTLFTEMTGVG